MIDAMSNTTANPAAASPVSALAALSRPAPLVGAALALVAMTALATTWAVREPSRPTPIGTLNASTVNAEATATRPLDLLEQPGGSGSAVAQAQTRKIEPANKPAVIESAGPPAKATIPLAKPSTAMGSACASCGVVKSVTPVEQKGEATGVGAVGGAVVGALLGSQVGGGNGKKAMTVIGAMGGGAAGHEIEKRARGSTVYRVSVRMEDGSIRTLTQAAPPAVGQKVTVDEGLIRARS